MPPVRYIKSIGDEVMLVSSDPVAMLDAVLDLVDATEAIEGFPGCAPVSRRASP